MFEVPIHAAAHYRSRSRTSILNRDQQNSDPRYGTSILKLVTERIKQLPRSASAQMAALQAVFARLRSAGITVPLLGSGGKNLRYLIVGFAAPSNVTHAPGTRCSVKHRQHLAGILDDMGMNDYAHVVHTSAKARVDDACAFLSACTRLAFEGCAVSQRPLSLRVALPTLRGKLNRMKERQMARFTHDPKYRAKKKQSSVSEYDEFLDTAIARRIAAPTAKDSVELLWQFERPAMAVFSSQDFLIPALTVVNDAFRSRSFDTLMWYQLVKDEIVFAAELLLTPLSDRRTDFLAALPTAFEDMLAWSDTLRELYYPYDRRADLATIPLPSLGFLAINAFETIVLRNSIVHERLAIALSDEAMQCYDQRSTLLANQCRLAVVYVRAFIANGEDALELIRNTSSNERSIWFATDSHAGRAVSAHTARCKQLVTRRSGWIYSLPRTLPSLPNCRGKAYVIGRDVFGFIVGRGQAAVEETNVPTDDDLTGEEPTSLQSIYDQRVCVNEGGDEKGYTLREVEACLRADPMGEVSCVPWEDVMHTARLKESAVVAARVVEAAVASAILHRVVVAAACEAQRAAKKQARLTNEAAAVAAHALATFSRTWGVVLPLQCYSGSTRSRPLKYETIIPGREIESAMGREIESFFGGEDCSYGADAAPTPSAPAAASSPFDEGVEDSFDCDASAPPPMTRSTSRRTSRFLGLSWDAVQQTWEVKTDYGGTTLRIGRFREEINAALAYDAFVIAHQLDLRLNFPDE